MVLAWNILSGSRYHHSNDADDVVDGETDSYATQLNEMTFGETRKTPLDPAGSINLAIILQ